MMTGRVTREREAIIAVRVRTLGGRPETVEAELHTGFSEFLALPDTRSPVWGSAAAAART